MDRTTAEKEWLRRISGGKSAVPQRKPTSDQTSDQSSSKPRPKPQPTAKKHGNGFGDIAGMEDLKQRVKEGFINVLQHRDLADAYGIRPPSMLFYGPAGCGKTFFAEKMAEEVGIHFIKVVPDDLASTMVHGTQEKIGEVFKNAERHAPALLFFDEFDAMVPRRTGNEYNQHYDSEVNEFLCMLNHASDKGVYVLAATNHPERIDKAVLRTGRIDRTGLCGFARPRGPQESVCPGTGQVAKGRGHRHGPACPPDARLQLQRHQLYREVGSTQEVQRGDRLRRAYAAEYHPKAARRDHLRAQPLGQQSRSARIPARPQGVFAQGQGRSAGQHRISVTTTYNPSM